MDKSGQKDAEKEESSTWQREASVKAGAEEKKSREEFGEVEENVNLRKAA